MNNNKRTAVKNLNVGDYFAFTDGGPQYNRVSGITVGGPGEGTVVRMVTPSGIASVKWFASLTDVYVL